MAKYLISATALAVTLATWSLASADAQSARGTLKSVTPSGTEMVVTDEAGKDQTYHVVDGALVICPAAKDARINDVKAGAPVSVLWRKKGEQHQALGVVHHDGDFKNAGLAQGKFKSGDNKQLVVTDDKGKEFTYHVDVNTRIRHNKLTTTASAFKPGEVVTFVYLKQGDLYQLLEVCNAPE